jgi:hypothetical protein
MATTTKPQRSRAATVYLVIELTMFDAIKEREFKVNPFRLEIGAKMIQRLRLIHFIEWVLQLQIQSSPTYRL